MGTRGSIGFRINEQDKLTYNHFDSYPESLGEAFVDFVREAVKDDMLRQKVEQLKIVDTAKPPTPEDIKALKRYTNLNVSNQSTSDWYCLTREAQGNLAATLDSGYLLPDKGFIRDSVFCEYAYILNLDTKKAEFYKGFNQDPKAPGRYSSLQRDRYTHETTDPDYFGCKLVAEFPMDAIPDDWMEQAYGKDEEE